MALSRRGGWGRGVCIGGGTGGGSTGWGGVHGEPGWRGSRRAYIMVFMERRHREETLGKWKCIGRQGRSNLKEKLEVVTLEERNASRRETKRLHDKGKKSKKEYIGGGFR